VLASLVALVSHASRLPVLSLGRKPGTNVFRPQSPEHPEDETFPGLLMLRPAGGIYYANAPRIGEEIRALINEIKPRVLVLDLSAVPVLEFTALKMLTDGEEKVREAGTSFWLVGLNPGVLATVRKSPLWARLGRERMFFTLEQAVEQYQREGGGTRSGTE
jgi:MFS superfamily sulfate permease-like transporter